jgi:hypothetical protein
MIISFAGKAGVGKDAAASLLVEKYKFVKVALADPIKRICQNVFGFTDDQLWGPSNKRNEIDYRYKREDGSFLTPREALQTFATEFGRKCYPDIWVDTIVKTYEQLSTGEYYYIMNKGLVSFSYNMNINNINIVVPDVRFENEVIKLKEYGPVILIKRSTTSLEGKASNHSSETSLDDIPIELFDAEIINDESICKLNNKVKSILLMQENLDLT